MIREKIIQTVIAKLAYDRKQDEMDAWRDEEKNMMSEKIEQLANKYKKLTVENAIAYAKEVQKLHNFEVPEKPKTKEKMENGEKVIYVELVDHPEKHWLPVWWLKDLKGLYAEY